jgi:hypothetical protein
LARLRLLTRRKFNAPTDKWVTRARPKIDRIACPWLIRRFIDPRAAFIYVPPADVLPVAAKLGVVPYDIEGVAFSHEGKRCSFDTILRIFGLADPALDRLAGLYEALTRPNMISRRNAAACSRSRSACRRTFQTTTTCLRMAW